VITTRILDPVFEHTVIDAQTKDGYWLMATDVNGDGRPDLVASGLAIGEVVWYENPTWERHHIATFEEPVAMVAGDIAGDGRQDIVICHDYGRCAFDCQPEDGKVSWLRNPGRSGGGAPWEDRPIGDLVSAHRLLLGSFAGGGQQLLAFPVVGADGGPDALHSPVRVTLYDRPDDVLRAAGWPARVVDDTSFRIIHGVLPDRHPATPDRQAVVLASEEGLTWLGCDRGGGWRRVSLAAGELSLRARTGLQGCGDIAFCRAGDDAYAFLVTLEPFHGSTVAIYARESGSGLVDASWTRMVLDVYGDPNERGEGSGHHVVAGDFDGDGDDEFLVGLRGPRPWQGVIYYKAVDHRRGLFVKKRVSDASTARIAVADFDGDGRLDFATISYYTPGYFLADEPQVKVCLNRFAAAP
jgi:hypothetical protein